MDERDVGEMGEGTLAVWASHVGICANKSGSDKTGWDFLLELPPALGASETITLPLPKVQQPIQCFVQVKSTDVQPKKRQVKLSNWLRSVHSPVPVFFLVLEFDGEDDCQRAYLVHVGEEYIRRVLRRLCELGPEHRDELHKRTLQLDYSEDDSLSSPNGKGLLQAIESHIDSLDLDAYVEWKREVVRTAGYEDGRWQLDFVMAPPDEASAQELLVDLSLGLISHLDVPRGRVWDTRFGILDSQPAETFKGGRVEILDREADGQGTILLTTPDRKTELRLLAQVYLPQGLGLGLERKHFKARFAAPFVDFVLWPYDEGKVDIKFSRPPANEDHELTRLHPVSSLILLLNEASLCANMSDTTLLRELV